MAGKRRAQGKHFGDHFLDRVALEDPRVEAVLQHREPRVEGGGIACHAAVAADAGKAREVAGYVPRAAFGQFDLDADVLAHHGFERHAGVFADQQQFVVERPRQGFGALEGFQQQFLLGVGQVVKLEQAAVLWRQQRGGQVHDHAKSP
ncbi:hypothetical protein D9M71_442280 [compost metagenome]